MRTTLENRISSVAFKISSVVTFLSSPLPFLLYWSRVISTARRAIYKLRRISPLNDETFLEISFIEFLSKILLPSILA